MNPVFQKMEDIKYDNIFNYMKDNKMAHWHSTNTTFFIRVDKELRLVFCKQFTQFDVELTPRNYAINYLHHGENFIRELDIFLGEIQAILLADKLLDGLSVKNVKEKVRKI